MVAKLWPNKAKDLLKGMRLGPPCLQIVPFLSLSQGEAEGAFLPSIAAWFVAVLAQRSCKPTGKIFPGAVAVPGLRRCPKALGFSIGVGTEAPTMEELPPGRVSSGHLAFGLEARRAARVQKFLTSSSCPCAARLSAPPSLVLALRGTSAARGALPPSGSGKPAAHPPADSWQGSGLFPARSTCVFHSCSTGRLREGQAAMAAPFSSPFQVCAVAWNALQVSARAGMEAGGRSGHTSCLPFGSAVQITLIYNVCN